MHSLRWSMEQPGHDASQTTFNREAAIKRQKTKQDNDTSSLEKNPADAEIESVGKSSPAHPVPQSYILSLRVWNGTFTDESILTIFLRPFPFLLSPVVRHHNLPSCELPF